ncbi:MAG: serine/threonine protein kinase [Gemmatimonadales bacterium]|nr:serine/threonine protein kinase [Gemmatimonadales bacterium]
MSFLLERVRKALRPHYEVERELASGGMGIVFVAHDPTLDRRVAIKVLRPEMATAVAAERFLREARLLATLSHPNIVAIHQAGEAGGLHYYVMDLIEGESLAARLERGPLSPPDVASLGVQLLSALEAVHQLGTVHRDVKPANIFLMKDRALLGDFGIARTSSDPTLTKPDQWVGTPAYAAPEQSTGDVSPRTDLYSVGMVLYEACSGRRWSPEVRAADADWTGVPLRVAASLKRALARSPDNRWADATEFRKALERIQHRSILRPAGVMALIAAAALLLLVPPAPLCNLFSWWPRCGGPPALPDLAIPPLAVAGGVEQRLGHEFAEALHFKLRGLPGIELAHPDSTRAHNRTEGRLTRQGDELLVSMDVLDANGERIRLPEHRAKEIAWAALPDSIGLDLVREVFPRSVAVYGSIPSLATKEFRAISEFLAGEIAFGRDAWTVAADHFEAALTIDSTFAQAAWRLADTRRWRRIPSDIDLAGVYAAHKADFGPLDTLLIVAQLEPELARRSRIYAHADSLYPHDFYSKFVYGNELFHRGPLSGVPLEQALNTMEVARTLNPRFGPVLNQVAWAYISLGRRQEAARTVAQRDSIDTPPGGDLDVGRYLGLAYLYRFAPDSAEAIERVLLAGADEALITELVRVVRMALSFDIPDAQLQLGGWLASLPDATPLQHAAGHTAQGLALIAIGRPVRGLAHLDSALTLSPTDEALLQANEWRVLLPALGVEGLPENEMNRGRQVLKTVASDGHPGVRAAWALGVDAYHRNDAAGLETWLTRARQHAMGDESSTRLVTLLDAMRRALTGDHEGALELSRPLFTNDSAGRVADPFARATLHRHRAIWYEKIGQPQHAEKEWLWYENSDFPGWLEGEAHAAEIDWAVGTYARLERSRVLRALGNEERACQMVRRLVEIWRDPEPRVIPLRDRAVAGAGECGS